MRSSPLGRGKVDTCGGEESLDGGKLFRLGRRFEERLPRRAVILVLRLFVPADHADLLGEVGVRVESREGVGVVEEESTDGSALDPVTGHAGGAGSNGRLGFAAVEGGEVVHASAVQGPGRRQTKVREALLAAMRQLLEVPAGRHGQVATGHGLHPFSPGLAAGVLLHDDDLPRPVAHLLVPRLGRGLELHEPAHRLEHGWRVDHVVCAHLIEELEDQRGPLSQSRVRVSVLDNRGRVTPVPGPENHDGILEAGAARERLLGIQEGF